MFLKNKQETPPTNPNVLPHNFDSYIDTSGELSNKSLKRAEWYLSHRLQIHKIILRTLIILNVVLIVYSIYGWGRYFFFDYTNVDRTLISLSQTPTSFPQLAPRNIELRNAQVFMSSSDTFDFMVDVTNPNKSWKAKVTYNFSYSGGKTEEVTADILPGADQILPQFGVTASSFPINVQANVTNIEWERIDAHRVPDPAQVIDTRVQFAVENVKFTPSNEREGIIAHAISFDIVNNSVYGYWAPVFDVILINNQTPVGIQRVLTEPFRPAERKTIELRSFAPQLRVTSVLLKPRIKVFDTTEYIPPGK